jgi:quinol-cytochrome oxidoreductase complex cytochrome b subunit
VIGSVLLILAMFEGFFGYSLPDDLLSGTGLRLAFGGITMSVPIVGTWTHWLIFGGDFPGDVIVPRMYIAHVLLIPGIMLALIAAHIGLVWYQKHTQLPGPARTELKIGQWGKISGKKHPDKPGPKKCRAWTTFRDTDGVSRPVDCWDTTERSCGRSWRVSTSTPPSGTSTAITRTGRKCG